MRKIILSVAISLDGMIEGSMGEYDWCPPPSQGEMEKFLAGIDTIFMGRRSFEMMGPNAFPGKHVVVFSNSLTDAHQRGVTILRGDVLPEIGRIKQEPGRDIWLFGGASLVTTFQNHDLIDEMWIGLVPVVLGAGKPLFQGIEGRHWFAATEAEAKAGYVSARLVRKTKI